MRSFSFSHPDTGVTITFAQVDHGEQSAVILFGDLNVKTLYIGDKGIATATYDKEVAPYRQRQKDGK